MCEREGFDDRADQSSSFEQEETILEQKETKVTKGRAQPEADRQGMEKPESSGQRLATVVARGQSTKTAEASPALEFFVTFVTFCSNVLLYFLPFQDEINTRHARCAGADRLPAKTILEQKEIRSSGTNPKMSFSLPSSFFPKKWRKMAVFRRAKAPFFSVWSRGF